MISTPFCGAGWNFDWEKDFDFFDLLFLNYQA